MKPSRLLVGPAAVTLALVAACYEPEPPLGLPCSSEMECPSGQRCLLNASDELRCLREGEGMDGGGEEEDGNDAPANAISVSRGGTFPLDFTGTQDDAASSCATGRPELFFELELEKAEVIYLDTFGSAVDTAIAVRAGECDEDGRETACVDDSCGGGQSQGAWGLTAGKHCILVEGPAASAGDPTGKLVVLRGKHPGDPLPMASGTVSGDSCQDDNSNDADSCGCEPAKDHHYFFTVCPQTSVLARFDTCNGANWDTVLQLRFGDGDGLACDDDSCDDTSSVISQMVRGPGLFWAILDGCEECGPYTMKYSLTPM